MHHVALPARRHGKSRFGDAVVTALYGPLTAGEYLHLRRVASGYELGAFARAYAMVAVHGRPGTEQRPTLDQSRAAHRRTRDELALLEKPGAIARDDAVLHRIASLIAFDPAVYRQLATQPADRHPRVCRGCGCSGHDACSTDDSVCSWSTPAMCSFCIDAAVADASAAA